MGGRGNSSGRHGAPAYKIKSADDIANAKDFGAYMAERGFGAGISGVDPSLEKKGIPAEALRGVATTVQRLYKDLGLDPSESVFNGLNALAKGNALMSCTYQGTLQFNPATAAGSAFRTDPDGARGFHPGAENGQPQFISDIQHELGHAIEGYLIEKRFSADPTFNHPMKMTYRQGPNNLLITSRNIWLEPVLAWNGHKIATEIIGQAARNLKSAGIRADKVAYRYSNHSMSSKGNHINDYVASVSGYAEANRSQALAECVQDYMANGSNASPLSRQVWKIIKREVSK